MELMAEHWTEERLDDLKGEVEKLERRVDDGFGSLRTELREEVGGVREEVGDFRKEVNARFASVEARLDSMYRVMIVFGASMFGALAGLVAAVIVTQL